jgi:predicted nucleic acid-binding protein
MKGRIFVDTSIFVYLYSLDEEDKTAKAVEFINENDCFTSIQVINEISNVLLKKFKVSEVEILAVIDEIDARCEILPITMESIKNAISIKREYNYSYYDSLIISVALINGCENLISEDMQTGQIIANKLTIRNIFK